MHFTLNRRKTRCLVWPLTATKAAEIKNREETLKASTENLKNKRLPIQRRNIKDKLQHKDYFSFRTSQTEGGELKSKGTFCSLKAEEALTLPHRDDKEMGSDAGFSPLQSGRFCYTE